MSHHQLLLLAASIGEWQSAVDHVEACERIGVVGPQYGTLGRLRAELRDLCWQWVNATGQMVVFDADYPQIVAEARAFATEHQSEIDDLTNLTEGN